MQFSLYRIPRKTHGLLVDVQSNLLDELRTRVVIPLLRQEDAPKPIKTLNPCIQIDNQNYVLLTQNIASVPQTDLGELVGTAMTQRDTIIRAIDTMLSGL
jgi:toxin CcdB